jgi:hypothetical protein
MRGFSRQASGGLTTAGDADEAILLVEQVQCLEIT